MNSYLQLKKILTEEIEVHQHYNGLLAEETHSITKFNAEKVEELTAKREIISEEIKRLSEERIAFVNELTGSEKTVLRDVIDRHFKGKEANELKKLRDKLRSISERSRQGGIEFNQIVNFAMNLVNGTMSLIMAVTQNIVKSYSRSGTLQETYTPVGPTRRSGVSREA